MSTNHKYQLHNELITDVVNFRDTVSFVELFIIGEQVMADMGAYEDFYNVFSTGN